MVDILQKIKLLRLTHNWSEYELSIRSGIPQNTISSWYRQHHTPTLYSLEKICQTFDLSLSAFLAEENQQLELSCAEKEFLKQIRLLTPSQKTYFLQFLESFFNTDSPDTIQKEFSYHD